MAQHAIPAPTLRKGTLIAVVSAAFYGSSVIFIRFAFQAGVLPATAVFLRFAIASIVLLLFLWAGKRWITLSRRQTIALFLLGFLGFSIMGTTAFVALSLIPAWLVLLFTSFYPVYVNLGSWLFFGEQIGRYQILAVLSVFCGAALLFWQPFEGAAWTGILLMILNGITVAIYILVGQQWTQGIPPLISTAWTVIGAALGTLLYAVARSEFTLDFAPIGWLWAFCFAVISTVLSISLMWWAIGLIGSSRVTILGSFEPLIGVILAVLLLGERMTSLQLVGGTFIIAGMFLVQWQSQPNNP